MQVAVRRHHGGGPRSPSEQWADGAFEAHYVDVYRYTRSQTDQAAAEDLAQETFLICLASPRLRKGLRDSPRPVLFGVATRLVRQYWRQQDRRNRAMARAAERGHEHSWDVAEECDARIDAGALGPMLARSLARMPDGDREVLLLFALAGLGPAEIAEALRINTVTVRVRLHRARKRLRAQLPVRPEAAPSAGQPLMPVSLRGARNNG
jgi:RNA polymerase sigma-70 factor (ECF subfamily)